MNNRKIHRTGAALLEDQRIRRVDSGELGTLYSAVDVVMALGDTEHPEELWGELKGRERAIADLVQMARFEGEREEDALTLDGLFRLIQSFPSARAERLRQWLAQTARQRVQEAENPELAILRAQQAYQQQGYDRDWSSKRLQTIGGRRSLAGEWYRRGIRESEEFRSLTNDLFQTAFGMDVNTYRRYKGLWRNGQNLRDHMTELELALVSLGETVAANLHRERRSNGFEAVSADTKDAGSMVALTRAEIERQLGRSVVSALNHVDYAPRKRSRSQESQDPRQRRDLAA